MKVGTWFEIEGINRVSPINFSDTGIMQRFCVVNEDPLVYHPIPCVTGIWHNVNKIPPGDFVPINVQEPPPLRVWMVVKRLAEEKI